VSARKAKGKNKIALQLRHVHLKHYNFDNLEFHEFEVPKVVAVFVEEHRDGHQNKKHERRGHHACVRSAKQEEMSVQLIGYS